MATTSKLVCSVCSTTSNTGKLISSLRRLAENKMPTCCGQPKNLSLQFAFALGVRRDPFFAVAAFLPDPIPQWRHEKAIVEFFPFLVVLQRSDASQQSIWLPYWHLVSENGKKKHKYGQWAPFMEVELFSQLVGKAADSGYSVS